MPQPASVLTPAGDGSPRAPRVSVLTPVFDQAAFLPRALGGLLAQDVEDWELVVVDDGSTEDVATALPAGPRLRLLRHDVNRGLGAALNTALDAARAPVVAYLPADDVWHAGHLRTLLTLLDASPGAALAHSARSDGGPDLQLVQIAHRLTPDRWRTRDDLEADDLELLLLDRLRPRVATPAVTCTWTAHPAQRHRALRPSCDGGVATFRRRYGARGPLRIHADGHLVEDEHVRYAPWLGERATAPPPPSLRVLLAGELAYNPERILALEERGAELLGLWIDDPLGFMTVGPLPFGHVRDVELSTWRAARPDVVLALLNWRAVPLAHRLLDGGVPLVLLFKEAPQRSLARGEWPLLAEVASRAQALVLCSEEERAWFLAALPGRLDPARTHVLDGDLPKREWLDAGTPAAPVAAAGARTVLLGRPYGFDAALLEGLADRGVIVEARTDVGPADWVRVLSAYDAGWLHPVAPRNGGDIRAATWDDLNLPARLPTLVAAGLPLIAPRGASGAVHAAARLAAELGCGVLYEDLDDLAAQLTDPALQQARRDAAWSARTALTFDHHADRLMDLLRSVAGGS